MPMKNSLPDQLQDYFLTLSEVQKEAALWDEGPLLVLAGPGSGKTRVLISRVARLLYESLDDNFRILCLTFTNKAANEMRERIKELVPNMERRLFLGTFHSFCSEVLRQHGSHVGVNPDFTIYSDETDLKEILQESIQLVKSFDTNNLFSHIDVNLRPIIQRLKSSAFLPDEITEKHIKDPILRSYVYQVYIEYEKRLKKLNGLDYDSLILKVTELFSNYPFVAEQYRILYPYICIDEFQDTNRGQYRVIQSLTNNATEHQNVFIVADDDQVIYQWNGAHHKRVEQFQLDYNSNVIHLTDNYRCPSEIVDLANNLIRHNIGRQKNKLPIVSKKLKMNENESVIRLINLRDVGEETIWIAKDLVSRFNNNFRSIAILARNRKMLNEIVKMLENNDIPHVLHQRKNEFESTPMLWIHSCLRLAHRRNDSKALLSVIKNFDTLTGIKWDIDEILSIAQAYSTDLFTQWVKIALDHPMCINMPIIHSLQNNLITSLDFLGFVDDAFEWIEEISEKDNEGNTRFVQYDDEKTVWESFIKELIDVYGKDQLTLSTLLQELDLVSKELDNNDDKVQCMTIHSAKGKEFDHVYLMGLVEDELPSFQSKRKGDSSVEMEEERRNCFVAITRTKETLTLTYSDYVNGWSKSPSRFLNEMGIN